MTRSAALPVLLMLAACAPPRPVVGVVAEFGAGRLRGQGVVLQDGRVLTAAHVVDEASLREAMCHAGRWPGEDAPYLRRIRLGPAGTVAATEAVRLRIGESTFPPLPAPAGCEAAYRGGADLALLRPQAALGPGLGPCGADPPPGTPVLVMTATRDVPATLAGHAQEADPANGRYRLLAARLEQGDSGAAVVEPAAGCLLGIVSRQDPAGPDLTWVVQGQVLRNFLASPD